MENMNNVNLTNEALLIDADQREWTLNCVRQGDSYTLRKSHIWTKLNPDGFKTVCGVYMTVNQLCDFFGAEKSTVQTYTRSEYNGKPNEYRKELIEAGVITLSNEECKNLVENFMRDETAHETLENDMTDSRKIHSRGAVLYSLEAVMKLGMLMSGTPTARKFRDLIIESLKEGVQFEEAYNNVLDGYLNQMLLSAQKGELFDPAILGKVMESVSDTSLICYKNDITRTIDSLNNIYSEYMNLLQGINMITQRFQYTQVKSVIELLMISLNELQQVIIELDSVRLKANTAKDLYNRTEILKDAVLPKANEASKDYNLRINQLTSLLELAGYISIETDYQAPQRDAAGKKITLDKDKCDSKANLFVDINGNTYIGAPVLKYNSNDEDKQWIFNNEYVMNRDTKQQILKYTPVGRSLWGALYRQADVAYDKILAKFTDSKGNVNVAKLKDAIKHGKTNQSLIRMCKHEINLTKEEFEAQYAYAVLNNKTNTIVLL